MNEMILRVAKCDGCGETLLCWRVSPTDAVDVCAGCLDSAASLVSSAEKFGLIGVPVRKTTR